MADGQGIESLVLGLVQQQGKMFAWSRVKYISLVINKNYAADRHHDACKECSRLESRFHIASGRRSAEASCAL